LKWKYHQKNPRWSFVGQDPERYFDHTSNEEVLEELKVEPIDEKLRRYKSNWLRHVTRMNNNRVSKIMLNCKPNGRR
jgi:hypothetical protein